MTNENEERITYFGETDCRNKRTQFGIKAKDRSKHVYVIGKTGMGKSTLLENMAVQDIKSGAGLAFIDPHGASAEKLLDYIPEERVNDTLYFAPFDIDHPVSFNILEDIGADKRHLVVNGLMSTFEKLWVDMWSARMAYILQNTLLALLEYPDSTLLGVNRMFIDKEYRKRVVEHVTDPAVKSFWTEEFAKYTDRYTQEATPAIQNKVGQFVSNPLIRNIIGQPNSAFDIREMMDNKKILIVNLAKGKVGEGNANLLGGMIITRIYLAAMSRADVSEAEMRKLPDFYLYIDEFQSFANKTFENILSEARKYKLDLTIAHQYIEQMEEEVRDAVFGNVGTMITFRVGAFDAEVLEKEFEPTFYIQDLVNLGVYQIYLKLMIDGLSSAPFSAVTIPPIEPPQFSYKDQIIAQTRERYGRPKAIVEDEIRKWHEPLSPTPVSNSSSRQEQRGGDNRRGGSASTRRGVSTSTEGTRPGASRNAPKRPKRDEWRAREDQSERQKTTTPKQFSGNRPARLNESFGQARRPSARAGTGGETISLRDLKAVTRERVGAHPTQRSQNKATNREPAIEHRSALRDALADVLKDESPQKSKEEKKPTEKTPVQQRQVLNRGGQVHQRSTDTKGSLSNNERNTTKQKEIPEAELRKMLDVEDTT